VAKNTHSKYGENKHMIVQITDATYQWLLERYAADEDEYDGEHTNTLIGRALDHIDELTKRR